jgi:Fic family protein
MRRFKNVGTFNRNMYVERRASDGNVKYYLVHSYRDKGKIKKIRRYLGLNLSDVKLAKKAAEAGKEVSSLVESLKTEVFKFKLTQNQLEKLNNYDRKISIFHLNPKEWQKFTEEFVYNTNAIEGSTVRKGEVPSILEGRAKNTDELETKGVAKAVAYIRTAKEELSLKFMLKLHSLCFSGSKPFAGKLRAVEVVIRNANGDVIHRGMPAKEVRKALEEMVAWHRLNKGKFKPLVLAAIIHNQFEYIHPFQDGNGRAGRLLLNYILLKSGYPPINIRLEDRARYYQAIQDYGLLHDVKPMLRFLISQYRKTLRQVTPK